MADASGVYTVVKSNVQTGDRTFSFLPPHGKTLAPNEEYSVFGDLFARLSSGGRTNERKRAALEAALIAEELLIISSPQLILEDTSTSAVKAVTLAGGTLDDTNPSWGAFSDLSS